MNMDKKKEEKKDIGVQVEEKKQKKIIRHMTSFTDGAIARAKMMRGM